MVVGHLVRALRPILDLFLRNSAVFVRVIMNEGHPALLCFQREIANCSWMYSHRQNKCNFGICNGNGDRFVHNFWWWLHITTASQKSNTWGSVMSQTHSIAKSFSFLTSSEKVLFPRKIRDDLKTCCLAWHLTFNMFQMTFYFICRWGWAAGVLTIWLWPPMRPLRGESKH